MPFRNSNNNTRPRCNIVICAGVILCVGVHFVMYTIHKTETTWKAKQLWHEMKSSGLSTAPRRESMVVIEACENENTVVPARSRYAFVALLSDHFEEYALGAAKLGASLRMYRKDLDLILLELKTRPIPPHIVETHLTAWRRCIVPPIDGPHHHHHGQVYDDDDTPTTTNRFLQAVIYSKLHAWRLVEYDALVLLDLDIMALHDPSDIFDFSLQQMRAEGKQIGAVRDRPVAPCYPLMMSQARSRFNAGVLLIVPNQTMFTHLVASINTVAHDAGSEAEQAFMNQALKGQIYELSVIYNMFSVMPICEPKTWNHHKREIRFMHYTVGKPWTYSFQKYWKQPIDLLSCWFWGVAEYCALWDLVQ